MYFLRFDLIGVLLLFLSNTTAVPTGQVISRQDDTSVSPNCLVSPLSLSTIPDLFTLSAITWGDPTPWTVIFADGRTEVGYQPVITRDVIAEPKFQPSFSFQNGKLAIGPAADNLTAYFTPLPLPSPPLLEALCFSNIKYDSKFYGVANCDSNGTTYLELKTYYPLVVSKLEEGAKIYGRPYQSKETGVAIQLKINLSKPLV